MSFIQRAAGLLLVVIFLLGGVGWVDTLDLTDDVPLTQPLTVAQQVVEPEEGREYLRNVLDGALAFRMVPPVVSPVQGLSCSSARLVSPQPDRPLYQSLCTYRI
jgi:hypothetical protein